MLLFVEEFIKNIIRLLRYLTLKCIAVTVQLFYWLTVYICGRHYP